MKLIPAIYITGNNIAKLRRGDIHMLQRIYYGWQRDPRSRVEGMHLPSEMLRRTMQIEWSRVHNDGHFARLLDIDGSVSIALPAMLAWARERIDSMEYSLEDYV